MASIFQINLSKGGVPKHPVDEAYVSFIGIKGDVQKDKRYHGGPDRAICLFSIELIHQLNEEGHSIYPGSTGENFTISFPDYHVLIPGVNIRIGDEVVLQITSYAAPCKTIKDSFLNDDFVRISQKVFPNESRLYARVLKEGRVRINDLIVMENQSS